MCIGVPASILAFVGLLAIVANVGAREARQDAGLHTIQHHESRLACHDSVLNYVKDELRQQRPVWRAVARKLKVEIELDSLD
jgi:hypothetical protein